MALITSFSGGFAGYTSVNKAGGGIDEYTGTTMVFLQTSAPTGWTQVTSYDDYQLRVVSGDVVNETAGAPFTTLLGNTVNINSPAYSFSEGTLVLSFAPTTLTLSTIASHVHSIEQATAVNAFGAPNYNIIKPWSNTMVTALSSGAHTHSDVNASMPNTTRVSSTNTYLNVSYRDCIIATKD
jgi:hypothetical protein